MNLPDRVNLDLRQRERDNDDADEYFAMNRDSMIEEEVYRLEKSFSVEDLQKAIAKASAKHMLELLGAIRESERGIEEKHLCLWALQDIRDAWIKQKATEIVEEA